jgi:hypothetical protein
MPSSSASINRRPPASRNQGEPHLALEGSGRPR